MNRQEQVLSHYKRCIKEILPRIINDGDYWSGADVLPPNPSLFLPPSLVGVFSDSIEFVVVSEHNTGLEDYGGAI
jgi:hypothetical protein